MHITHLIQPSESHDTCYFPINGSCPRLQICLELNFFINNLLLKRTFKDSLNAFRTLSKAKPNHKGPCMMQGSLCLKTFRGREKEKLAGEGRF